MRTLSITALITILLLAALSASAQVTINQSPAPAVRCGGTQQFTASVVEGGGVTWSMQAGSTGSINASTGLYTAPGSCTASQSYGGYQLMPNDHIYNQRIDSLPLNAGQVSSIATAPTGAVRSGNVVTITTASNVVRFVYATTVTIAGVTDASFNGGPFTITGYDATCALQGGNPCVSFTYNQVGANTTSGGGTASFPFETAMGTTTLNMTQQPTWQLNYVDNSTQTINMVFSNTPTNNGLFSFPPFPAVKMESGWFTKTRPGPFDHHVFTVNTQTGEFAETYDYDPSGAGCGHSPANCNALSGEKYQNSTYALATNGGTGASGVYTIPLQLRLQEMEQAVALGSMALHHAFRFTLVNAYICAVDGPNTCGANSGSSTAFSCGAGQRHLWPATTQACSGSGLVPYGARFRLKASYNCGTFSAIAQIICNTLKQYGIILVDGGTGMSSEIENVKWPAAYWTAITAIDAANIPTTSFEAVDESSLRVSDSSGMVPTSETVIATGITTPSHTASQQVVLTAVTVGFQNDIQYIQAGTSAQQLLYAAHGGATNNVTCTMSPSVGTLTSGCLYTPPASVSSSGSSFVVTATSADDATVAAQETVFVLPTGSIYLRPAAPANFTDSLGHVWIPTGGDTAAGVGCCGDLSGGPWGALTDKEVYYYMDFSAPQTGCDTRFDITVPNGNYKVTLKFGPGLFSPVFDLDVNGIVYYSDVLPANEVGGTYKPYDLFVPTTVTNGTISIVLRLSVAATSSTEYISAIQIDPGGPGTQTAVAAPHIP